MLAQSFVFLWNPFLDALYYVTTAIAIRGAPSHFPSMAAMYQFMFAMFYFVETAMCLVVAFMLSRWVFGIGPFEALRKCHADLRKQYA